MAASIMVLPAFGAVDDPGCRPGGARFQLQPLAGVDRDQVVKVAAGRGLLGQQAVHGVDPIKHDAGGVFALRPRPLSAAVLAWPGGAVDLVAGAELIIAQAGLRQIAVVAAAAVTEDADERVASASVHDPGYRQGSWFGWSARILARRGFGGHCRHAMFLSRGKQVNGGHAKYEARRIIWPMTQPELRS
jgi:hypothetical protein